MNVDVAMEFPQMATVEQSVFIAGIKDVDQQLQSSLSALQVNNLRIQPGQSVAVAVGSRHIDRLHIVVSGCIRFLKQCGLKPFIVPAMGSHGGATPEGQSGVLAGYGISEETMGVPVRSEMETVEIGLYSEDMPLLMSQAALAADHIVLINRIKPHTKFKAPVESGLCKMLTVGLGKERGAAAYHRYAARHGFGIIELAALMIIEKVNLLFGIGLVEDGAGQISKISIVLPENFVEEEKRLLKIADEQLGRIFFDDIDVLIVDEIGKDISGIGMDSNVTGRHRDLVGDFCLPPRPKRIFVRDLSAGSDGNANGIGLADVTTSRLVERMDVEKTFTNAVTAISPEKAAIPINFSTDRQCLSVCIRTAGIFSSVDARIVRIRNTAALRYIQVSRALESDVETDERLTRITDWRGLSFDTSGNLTDFYSHE